MKAIRRDDIDNGQTDRSRTEVVAVLALVGPARNGDS
jgi:hypothetical protein